MVGERLRELRQARGHSLAEIAGQAKISVATLSRIETDKQSVDVELLLVLAGVLNVEPKDILGNGDADGQDLAQRIASLDVKKRAELWRDLNNERRGQRSRHQSSTDVGQQVEELLAQLDYLREELDAIRQRAKKRR